MKKRIVVPIVALTAFLAASLLTSCASPPPPPPQISMPVVLFYAYRSDFVGLSNEVRIANETAIRILAEALNAHEEVAIVLEGHANPTAAPGTPERAAEDARLRALSVARARAVQDRLIALGVDRAMLAYVGLGTDRIVVQFENVDDWWRNRRVEVRQR